MVNAIDLFFAEDLFQIGVELHGGLQVVAEGFFHDDAGPFAVFFLRQAGGAQLLDDGGEETRRYGEVVKAIAAAGVRLVHFVDLGLQALV